MVVDDRRRTVLRGRERAPQQLHPFDTPLGQGTRARPAYASHVLDLVGEEFACHDGVNVGMIMGV